MVIELLPQKNPSADIIAGQYKLSVEGKKMDSNPNERGVHIKSSKDYLLDVNQLSQSTISGIVSIKLPYTKHKVQKSAMTINPESNITVTVGGNAVRNVSGTLTDTITGKGLITMENNERKLCPELLP